jgi:hypothetical protein
MVLRFPELRGGTVQGLNDAGVENFQGAIDVYVSRECGQNTGDAPRQGIETVRLEFDRLELPTTDIPCFYDLRATLIACLSRWKDKPKEKEFFEQAVELASKDKISVLRISDYGTTGLTGDDLDERGRWFALVKSQGVSNKGDTAGGSFGIGKSSPFAASRFRTVFYGTRTERGSVALQGVSRLVSHKGTGSKLTQGTGFIGEYDGQGGEDGEPVFRAVRKEASIPKVFRRAEPGTDIWVIGYRSGDSWSGDLIRSILSNFWPAIHRGSIQFRVGQKTISKVNLRELIEEHIGQDDFEAHHYYKAILNQPITKRLKHTGTSELYLTASSRDLPRKLCMVRSSGMRIYDYQPKACRVPFSGLFICTDADGNKLLRKLEPPKHDAWDPKRTEDSSGKKALDEIKLWIREEVKKLNPLFSGSSFNESELAKYLPDTPDEPNDLPFDESGKTEEDNLEPKPRPDDPPITPLTAKPVVVKVGIKSDDGGAGPTGTGGTGPHGNGGGGTGGSGTKGGGSTDDTSPPSIRVRSYSVNADGAYEFIVRSDREFKGTLSVRAVGEDGQLERVSLVSATSLSSPAGGYPTAGDAIQDVNIASNVPLRIRVVLDALERRSLTAIAGR